MHGQINLVKEMVISKQDQKSIDAIGLVIRLYSTLIYRYISFIYIYDIEVYMLFVLFLVLVFCF